MGEPPRSFNRWDYKLPKSILDSNTLRTIAHSLRGPLHYTTGTKECPPSTPCVMCGNAMRLVIQSAEPRIIERVVERMASSVGHSNIDLYPRCADD
jgi:hypothetical protein